MYEWSAEGRRRRIIFLSVVLPNVTMEFDVCEYVYVRVFVYAYMCGGGRVFVWDGCARGWIVCFAVGWWGVVGRQQPFGGQRARLIPARLDPHLPRRHLVSTPQSDARTHTPVADTRRWGKKLEIIIIKLHVVFHPPPSCLCVCPSCIRFSYFFFFPPIPTPCLLRVINKYPRIYHITELTIIIKIGISLV